MGVSVCVRSVNRHLQTGSFEAVCSDKGTDCQLSGPQHRGDLDHPGYSKNGSPKRLFGVELDETEEEADLKDALAPIYDQLSLNWSWWVLEILPMAVRCQEKKIKEETREKVWEWSRELQFNLGQGRHVPRQHAMGMKIHRTVKTRMEAAHKAWHGRRLPG